ncbi:methyltransferase [Leucobacter albus]|uniref:Methyltransferase n=1 Tax=Leucobacter albus TaxID=272210 RepID=A0ABW3TKG9_9MICO
MNSGLISQLRGDLLAADYSTTTVAALWGATAEAARLRGVFQPAKRVLSQREQTPLVTLARVFLLGEAVDCEALDRALPRLGSGGAAQLGLVAAKPTGEFRAALSLNPVARPAQPPPQPQPQTTPDASAGGAPASWWIISDLDDELRGGPARPDHVMGVGGATRTLIAQIPPIRPETALDLGTGCGIVALALAELGAKRIVASDISERALEFARANAELNDFAGRIEFRAGSLFEPFAGERFDLIVSNPPFVITPRGDEHAERYDYRDGGMTGDELAASVVRAAPRYLAAAGSLVCLANWETEWGGHGLERVAGWIRDAAEGSGSAVDAWVIERDRVDTVQYAETWARDGGARPGQPEFAALLGAWLDDFGARRVVSVGLGAIHLRRNPSAELGPDASVIHIDQATGALASDALGASLRDAFDSGCWAARASDEAVLATRWVRATGVVEERRYTPGEESPNAISLATSEPIERRVVADTLLAAAVGVCDGELTLGQIADALATLLEVDADAAAEALVAGARELAWFGMLRAS